MDFSIIVTGVLEENCYIVYDKQGNCVIVDPGDDSETIADFIAENDLEPKAILLTHGHFDHTGAVVALKERYEPLPVYIHYDDRKMLKEEEQQGIFDFGTDDEFEADAYFEDGAKLNFGELTFTVLHTPGHTKGSCCFICEDAMFAGDTLFRRSIGRVDLPGGSLSAMTKTLRDKIALLPKDLTVYPGHGEITTIEEELAENPYILEALD